MGQRFLSRTLRYIGITRPRDADPLVPPRFNLPIAFISVVLAVATLVIGQRLANLFIAAVWLTLSVILITNYFKYHRGRES